MGMIQVTAALRELVSRMLTRHESKKTFPYDDKTGKPILLPTGGKITIGIGRNLTDKGLSEEEIQFLFANDMNEATDVARSLIGSLQWERLSQNRQAVLIDMAFNMGRTKLAEFVNTLQAIREGNYNGAAKGMRDSLWAKQVGARATVLADMMERG